MTRYSLHIGKASETSYLGGDITVDKDGLYSYLFGGGYCEFKPYAAYADSIKYYYYTKDHLGNVRNVIAKNNNGQMEELQQTHYYPFGGIIADISSGRNVQSRLYNGKEQDFVNNLFWLDYGARQYDPTRGQFTNPDPLAEKYYGWNYYTYCVNNPMNAIDPDGRTDYRINAQGYMYECTSFWEKIKSFLGFGNNSDRIFNESNGKLLVSCEEGSIKNLQTKTVTLKNGKTVKETSFEYSGNNGSEIYESIINSSEVEWAQISYKEKGSSDNIFITDHLQDEVSTFSGRLNNLEKKAEVTKLRLNHNHPVSLDDLNSNMGAFINLDPSPKDKVTAKNHPKVVFAVYNMYNRKIQYYNDKGIYYETKF